MKILEQISSLRNRATGSTNTGRVAIVHWDREAIYFLVVSPKSKSIASKEYGSIPHAESENPLMALSEYFRNQSISVHRLVVLLSRPELDIPTLNLPPADENELPSLIASEVEQQLGETEEPPVVDFHLIANPRSDKTTAIQVLAFALPAKELGLLHTQVAGTGFRLAAIGSRHLSPLSILRRQNISRDVLVVSVHLYSGEVELAVCVSWNTPSGESSHGVEPLLLRTIRLSTDDAARVAEQIWMEMQRCLTLLPQETAEMQLSWYVFETNDAAKQVADALESFSKSPIHAIHPLVDWNVLPTPSTELDSDLVHITSAANAGAAWDFVNNSLSVNLLSPKRAPKPLNPWIRWGVLGGGVAAMLGIVLYFLMSDLAQLQTEADSLQNDLDNAQKLTAKYQEKSDQVVAVQGWLADQVDWLTELNELSNRLPDGEDATVRRLTASASPNGATIDLAVQVAQQEFISQVESRIRSAKYSATSKQISQNASSVEYPWQFDTRISFAIESQKQNAYGPKVESQEAMAPETRVSEPAKGDSLPVESASTEESE